MCSSSSYSCHVLQQGRRFLYGAVSKTFCPAWLGLASVKQCCQLIQFRLAFIYTMHSDLPPLPPSAMPGKSITMHAPHWLHLTAFNCNGPHEMSTASPTRQTFGLAYFSNCLPLSRSAAVSLSLSVSLASLGGTGAGAFGFGSLFCG